MTGSTHEFVIDRIACPRCGSGLRRVRRSFAEHVLGLIITSRRYECARPGCGWSGLLQGRPRRHGPYR